MSDRTWAARTGAVAYALWGLVHLIGGALQLLTLRRAGGGGLTAMIATARSLDPGTQDVPAAAAAFMGMGAFNLAWIGAFVLVVAVTLNWRNSRLGYWVNLAVVGATDLGMAVALLVPGYIAWSDALIGLSLFAVALVSSTIAYPAARAPLPIPRPA